MIWQIKEKFKKQKMNLMAKQKIDGQKLKKIVTKNKQIMKS